MDENVKSNEEVRKVAPLKISLVNLATLQDIKKINKGLQPRQSRRKSVHQVRSNSDEQIEFIESRMELANDDNSNSTIASSSNSATAVRKSFPTTAKKVITMKRGQETRPNESLMKRVALLRVCAEYMLNELHVKNILFGENHSLEMLKAQYIRNTRRKH